MSEKSASRLKAVRRRVRDALERVPLGDLFIATYRERRRHQMRRRLAMTYYNPRLERIAEWLHTSRETTNFTYDLTDLNRRYLAAFITVITGATREEVLRYFAELEQNRALANHIQWKTATSARADIKDAEARYARRLGWYAVVRIKRPRLVVETGVDMGLGACLLTAALQRNREEGYAGRYLGIDIDPGAGDLFGEPYAEFGEILTGDAVATLRSMKSQIDVYISDSDHSQAYETQEYEVVSPLLTPASVVIADNARTNPALLDFAERTGRAFLFFAEEPESHWYPGAGMGVAYPSR